mmetsp:Transcript_3858/g.7649  ORF Transcript_3858/g.7649 Transcript_3858/m.7649 type:complete len:236 (+) Transcript_3858:69-776(+)
MSRYAPLLNNDENPNANTNSPALSQSAPPFSKMSNMFQSLKESATSASSSVRDNMTKAASGLGIPSTRSVDSAESGGVSESSSMVDEVSEYCPKLTYQQRIMGFGICFTCGYLMTFMSFRLFIKLVEGNPAPFVFLYTSGNILSLMSSVFLSGPQRQFKNMFDEKRKLTSIVYLSTLCTSITVCFIPIPTGPKIGLLVILLLVQMCASLWYTLSYIPYGRASAKRMLRSIVAMDE